MGVYVENKTNSWRSWLIESGRFYEILGVFGSDLIKQTSNQDPSTSKGKGILGDFI
ncbi:hypothetical protein Scep_010131 [Stephania cephalantha]|uniref:Uncharacterized protein n=1 Tax=Stephania cephalantha TaxID=152367 RepID=A0AAP0JVH2_9MAGN